MKMKDFLRDWGWAVMIVIALSVLFSFFTIWIIYEGEKDKEMAKLGMCLTKIIGSDSRVWAPCK